MGAGVVRFSVHESRTPVRGLWFDESVKPALSWDDQRNMQAADPDLAIGFNVPVPLHRHLRPFMVEGLFQPGFDHEFGEAEGPRIGRPAPLRP
jgi:hypothetical protein